MWKCIPNNWVTYGTCHLIIWQFPHIIIHHHLQAAVVSHGWAKASARHLQITVLCCPLPYRVARVFVQVVSPPLGWSPLSTFLAIWSPTGDTQGPSVVFEAVDMPCPGPFHFSHSVDYIYEFCPLPNPDVGPSIFVCDVEHTSFNLVCAAASLFCACLVSVQVSAPYVIAGSTQELYTCLFRQMARLLLKISRCLAYAAQPAMIHRCIFVMVLFLSSVAVNSLGTMVSPVLLLSWSWLSHSLCADVLSLSCPYYVFQGFYVHIFYSLFLQWCQYCLGLYWVEFFLVIHESNTQWYVLCMALLFKLVMACM